MHYVEFLIDCHLKLRHNNNGSNEIFVFVDLNIKLEILVSSLNTRITTDLKRKELDIPFIY